MDEKTVQVVYHEDGGCTITYFLGDEEVGVKKLDETPKRMRFFLEKFPTGKGAAKSEK